MAASTQALPGVYVWEAPEINLAIHINLAIADALLPEIMRGFAAVPKRGAEVGGLLIGSIEGGEAGGQNVIHVEHFEPVACVYARGPSYLFTGEDRAAFEHACQRWSANGSETPEKRLIGYFRSHTREGLGLSTEDIELLDRYFPDPRQVAMLIRPFSAKPARAAFFVRENGAFPPESQRTFLFSRIEMAGGPMPPSAPAAAEAPDSASPRAPLPPEPAVIESPPPLAGLVEKPSRGRFKRMWILLSLALLLVGAIGGYEASRTMTGWSAGRPAGAFSLALHVVPIGDNLAVRWDPEALAVRNAQSGLLEIEDAGYSKPVDLDAAHLQSGSILYRSTSAAVRFRLIVYESARLSVSETVDWPH